MQSLITCLVRVQLVLVAITIELESSGCLIQQLLASISVVIATVRSSCRVAMGVGGADHRPFIGGGDACREEEGEEGEGAHGGDIWSKIFQKYIWDTR